MIEIRSVVAWNGCKLRRITEKGHERIFWSGRHVQNQGSVNLLRIGEEAVQAFAVVGSGLRLLSSAAAAQKQSQTTCKCTSVAAFQ